MFASSYTKPALVAKALFGVGDITLDKGILEARKPDNLRPWNVQRDNIGNRRVVAFHVDLQTGLRLDSSLVSKHRSKQKTQKRGNANGDRVPKVHGSLPPTDLRFENSLPHNFALDIREPLTYSEYMNVLPLDKKLVDFDSSLMGEK
jgi:hypothetical protein